MTAENHVNAKEELLEFLIISKVTLKCAIFEVTVHHQDYIEWYKEKALTDPISFSNIPVAIEAELPLNYSQVQLQNFLNLIDIEYHEMYASDVKGTLWFTDGTWAIRMSDECYSSWWHIIFPEIPRALLR